MYVNRDKQYTDVMQCNKNKTSTTVAIPQANKNYALQNQRESNITELNENRINNSSYQGSLKLLKSWKT